jgi:acyl-coenzyme A synthetase/AMP-(fatty) acid ligase
LLWCRGCTTSPALCPLLPSVHRASSSIDAVTAYISNTKNEISYAIKTSGYQVWPREIEDVIATHPAVAEVGVAKMPDAVKGEVAKAWVVLRPGTSTTADDIRAYCREHLAPYKVLTVVVGCRALPRTLLGGKVLRRLLGNIPADQHSVDSDDARAIT